MNDKNEFILHIAGLIVLSALAVFFAILQAKYKVEITDVGIILGLVASLCGAKTYQSLRKKE